MKGLRERTLGNATANLLSDSDPALVRDYYQSVLDSVGSVIYTVNRDLRITGVNQQWDAFALANGGEHLSSEHILGRHLFGQMSGEPLERWRTVCQQILDGELSRYVDEVASDRPFAWRHFSLTATPLRDSQGQILGITFVATNITQLKKAEHAMFQRLIEIRGLRQVAHTAAARSERRKLYKQFTADIAHLLGAEKCVIFLWDERSGNLQAQEPAFGLAGRKLADLSLDMGHPADQDSLWTDLEEKDYILLNEGDKAPADMIETSARVDRLAATMAFLRVSGRVHGAILVAGRDRPFSEQDGQLLALFAVPIALSIENAELNRRLLDRTQQLATTRDELGHVVKIKEAIRMPLTVVRGYLELLLEGMLGSVPEGQRATMRMVLAKTQTITSLVDRISPPQLPRDATRHEQIYLGDLVRRAVDERTFAIKQAGLELVTQLPEPHDERGLTVGDPDMLFKMFDALLDNAIKFSPGGGALHVSLHVLNGIIYVEIADPGLGISTDQLFHIWQPRKRAVSSGAINLAEVRRIVEGHGGQVWVESKSGQGSTFYVALRTLER
jgi:PAS domain S-box-containing protein